MFLSTTASSASCLASFSRAVRQASALPIRARVTSARSSGRRTRRALMAAICVFEIVRRRNLRLQLGQFLQEFPIGRVVILEAAFHS